MELKNGVQAVAAASVTEWRGWLEKNHQVESKVWLIIYRKESGVPSVYYDEAVEQALCFGWVDAVGNKRNEKSYYLYFSKRKPKSNWSKPNRERIEKLRSMGQMMPAGLAMVELAKQTGTWNALLVVENLEIPVEMQLLFDENPKAKDYWNAFPPSTKKGILEWILNAKTPATKEKRIRETVTLAAKNIRANQYQPKPK